MKSEEFYLSDGCLLYTSPDLYTVSPQQHHVYIGADGQHIEIRVENTLIRGSVQVTKTEAVEEPSPVEMCIRDRSMRSNGTL